jgi:hypothetical protein
MLYEEIGCFHTISAGVATPEACDGDDYFPNIVDWNQTYPTLQNACGGIYFWVQVAASGTSGTDTYQFILKASATKSTDLSGTIVDIVTSPTFTQSGAFCQKTDHSGGLWYQEVPPNALYRYWQGYINVTSVAGNLDMTVYAGLCLKSSLKAMVGNISHESGITFPS